MGLFFEVTQGWEFPLLIFAMMLFVLLLSTLVALLKRATKANGSSSSLLKEQLEQNEWNAHFSLFTGAILCL